MTRSLKAALLVVVGLASFSLQAQIVGPRSGPDLTNSLVGTSNSQALSSVSPVSAGPSREVLNLSTATFLSGVRGGWARYRFDPNDPSDPGLVVESTRRITQLGAKALFLYLTELKGSNETDLRSVAQSARFQTAFSIAKANGVQLLVLNVFAVRTDDKGLPYFGSVPGEGDARLATEFAQIRDLTAYLRSSSLLDGMTVILKNWESDWVFCGEVVPNEPSTSPCTPDNVPVLLQRAAPMTRWLQNRQDAVVQGRRTDLYPSPYSVTVLNAVDVNLLHDAIGGQPSDGGSHPRVAHLLPYVGADVLTYSSWDSVFHRSLDLLWDPPLFEQLGAGVKLRLDEAFTFLLNHAGQLSGATALCSSMQFCLPSVGFGVEPLKERLADPLALGVRRLVISEWGVHENTANSVTTSARTKAVLDKARSFGTNGIRAAFYWALYDNEQVWFESCTSLVPGHERECRAGTPWVCSEHPEPNHVGCNDKNL